MVEIAASPSTERSCFTLFALGNLFLVRQRMMAGDGVRLKMRMWAVFAGKSAEMADKTVRGVSFRLLLRKENGENVEVVQTFLRKNFRFVRFETPQKKQEEGSETRRYYHIPNRSNRRW